MRPDSEPALAGIIRDAREPLVPTGGGSRAMPGAGRGPCLETGALTGITLYEPEALTLVVRAGTPLADVQATLAAEGQMLGFEPDARAGSTIGGVVAANASGPRRVLSGACRDALIGVRFVDGTGAVVKNGGRVMKNVTGYDLVKLMAGSRGTLGVLTELAFKTVPVPSVTAILRLPGLDATAAIAALTSALTGPFDVSAAGWLPGQGALIRIEGLAGSVAIRRAALIDRLAPFGEIAEGDPQDMCHLAHPAAPAGADLWRILCRPSEAAGVLATLPEPVAVDWGGAQILAALPHGQIPALPRFTGHAQRITGATPMTLPIPDPVVLRMNADLRARFDPRGIFAGTG